jgi:hypothetical protein
MVQNGTDAVPNTVQKNLSGCTACTTVYAVYIRKRTIQNVRTREGERTKCQPYDEMVIAVAAVTVGFNEVALPPPVQGYVGDESWRI